MTDLEYVPVNPNPLVDDEEIRLKKVEEDRMVLRNIAKRWENAGS